MDEEKIRVVVRATIAEFLITLGVDVQAPGEAKNVQQDFAFLRSARKMVGTVRTSAITAIVTAAVTGLAALAWHAISVAKATGTM